MPGKAPSTLWRKLERVVDKLDERQKFCQLSQMISEDQEKWRTFNNEPHLLPNIESDTSTLNEQHRYYCRVQPAMPVGDLNERYRDSTNMDYICTIFHSDKFYPSTRSSTIRLKRYLKESEAWRKEVAGIACTSIDALLMKHFDNGISLQASSLSDNWVPLVLKLHVRTTEATWQKCLFVVFGEDKLRYRVEDSPQVREAIIDAWAVRQVAPISHHLIGRSRQKQSYKEEWRDKNRIIDGLDDSGQNEVSQDIKKSILRGRKRRHARWALQGKSAGQALNHDKEDLSPLHKLRKRSPGPDTSQGPRARLQAHGKGSESTGLVVGDPMHSTNSETAANTVTSSTVQDKAKRKGDCTIDRQGWYYETKSGKAASKNIGIRLHPSATCHYDVEHSVKKGNQEVASTEQGQDARLTEMPILSISNDDPETMMSKVKKKARSYALVSYRADRKALTEGIELNPDFEEKLIVAVFVDQDECIGELACETLGQWMNVTPELNMHRNYLSDNSDASHKYHSEDQLSESDHQESSKADSAYWHKFSQFIAAHPHTRRLPFSNGYGNKHSNPPLVRRSGRWGILNVDEVTSNSPYPRSRAVWSFNVSSSLLGLGLRLTALESLAQLVPLHVNVDENKKHTRSMYAALSFTMRISFVLTTKTQPFFPMM